MKRWAERTLRPTSDCWKELRAACRGAVATGRYGHDDFSYSRPSRRSPQGVVLPGMIRAEPSIAFVIDTSGSMSDKMVGRALAEIKGTMRAAGVMKVAVISCDAAVGFSSKVQRIEKVELVGGGGTDMRVGIDYATKLRPRPRAIIVLTDGDTPWGETPVPGVRVVAALVKQGAPKPPAWIRTVVIREQ
jgi:predicted metal-dependent peptidase